MCARILLSIAVLIVVAPTTVSGAGTIASVLRGNPALTTLVAALEAQGDLMSTLEKGTGPFTLFAPTNGAFTSGSMADYKTKYLLDKANKKSLTRLLSYHVVAGSALKASDLKDKQKISTANAGHSLFVDLSSGSLSIHDETCANGKVTSSDVAASNGIVQIVDSVFVPPGVFCPDVSWLSRDRQGESIVVLSYCTSMIQGCLCCLLARTNSRASHPPSS